MLRGIYSSASGMIMEMDKVSMHAANIANAQSAGYRKHEMSAIPFKELMINVMNDSSDKKIGKRTVNSVKVPVGTGSYSAFEELDNTQGSFKPTGNALDIAIEGGGWLTLHKGQAVDKTGNLVAGGQYTTRNGSFMLNDKGEIITSSGDFLVDEKDKKITINLPLKKLNAKTNRKEDFINQPTVENMKAIEARISIKENGDVFDNGKKIAKLKIQTDTDKKIYVPQLKLLTSEQKVATTKDNKLFDDKNNEIKLKQGFLENSNVQIISEMIGMIHASKNYESGHKLIMSEDKVLDKAINELGRTG